MHFKIRAIAFCRLDGIADVEHDFSLDMMSNFICRHAFFTLLIMTSWELLWLKPRLSCCLATEKFYWPTSRNRLALCELPSDMKTTPSGTVERYSHPCENDESMR